MCAAAVLHLAAAAMLAAQSPLAGLDGEVCDVHEIPRFVVERVELPHGARGDCAQQRSREPSCPALGISGAALQHGKPVAACLPHE